MNNIIPIQRMFIQDSSSNTVLPDFVELNHIEFPGFKKPSFAFYRLLYVIPFLASDCTILLDDKDIYFGKDVE